MARVRLLIEDPANRITLRTILEAAGHSVDDAAAEVVICDDMSEATTRAAELPTLVLAEASKVGAAVDAMRQGVFGYLFVPFVPGEAALMVERAAGGAASAPPEMAQETPRPLEAVEMDYIQTVLRQCRGNQAKAARVLGIGRNTLWRKLKKIR